MKRRCMVLMTALTGCQSVAGQTNEGQENAGQKNAEQTERTFFSLPVL